MNRCLDCIQIWYGCSLGISDDLVQFGTLGTVFLMIWLTFGMNLLKTKWLPQPFENN